MWNTGDVRPKSNNIDNQYETFLLTLEYFYLSYDIHQYITNKIVIAADYDYINNCFIPDSKFITSIKNEPEFDCRIVAWTEIPKVYNGEDIGKFDIIY